MDKCLKKNGDKSRAGKNQQIDSFFSRQDKKQSPNRAILDNITNNMAGSPEKTEEPLVQSPIISKSHKIESEVIEGTPDVTVRKSRLKRKRHEIIVKKEESKIKPEVEIPVSDNCRSPIFKRKRYSGDTDDKELVYDKRNLNEPFYVYCISQGQLKSNFHIKQCILLFYVRHA